MGKRALFDLGRLVATPAAIAYKAQHNIDALALLARHLSGDYGDLCDEDINANKHAVIAGGRIFSSYKVGPNKLWIITEADRSATTILLPEDY